jgi:hypothetical protein
MSTAMAERINRSQRFSMNQSNKFIKTGKIPSLQYKESNKIDSYLFTFALHLKFSVDSNSLSLAALTVEASM